MGFWKWVPSKKAKHDHEAGSSSASSRSTTTHSTSPAVFSISSPTAGLHYRPYVKADICRQYWETGTPLQWSDVYLPNN